MLFGLGTAAALAVSWLVLGRGVSHKLELALAFLFASGTVAAWTVECLMRLMRRSMASARFSAALLVLLLATAGIFCSVTTALVLREHLGEGLPLHILLLIFFYAGGASLYTWLAVGGWLLLPLGLPLILGYAVVLARHQAEVPMAALSTRNSSLPGSDP